jgi:S-adenosylmethionine synthetase
VTEGHPDKICDTIADAILDAYLQEDPDTRINCEVLAKDKHLVLAGEITSRARIDHGDVARRTIADIGYVDSSEPFASDTVQIHEFITRQSNDIDLGVSAARNQHGLQGAGDQGMMFGYATRQTPELMPLPIVLAHRLARQMASDRKSGRCPWMRPDGKTQVSVQYEGGQPVRVKSVVTSIQHRADASHATVQSYARDQLLPEALGDWHNAEIELLVNPTGRFVHGGPSADSGLTGRKIIVDTYGGFARHGGGSFSGKDASKVDRSAAYFCRFVAKQLVARGIAESAEIQVSYAIGHPRPVSIAVDNFGTGSVADAKAFVESFDFRPGAMIERLDLKAPRFRETTNYGHFGKSSLPWEASP